MCEQLNLFLAANEECECEPKEKKNELSPRAWALYRLIYTNSMVLHKKTSKREIYESIRGYEWNDDPNVHDHCSAIWKDVVDNNLSFSHDKIIIAKNDEYWLGNEEETEEFLNDLWNQLFPRLQRYWFYKAKIKRNGQGKLLSNNLDPIDENSKARAFVESFNPYRIGD